MVASAPARIIDFDAFRAEQNKEPVILKIGGKSYNLPSDLPATVALDLIRARKEHGDNEDMPPDFLASIGQAIFGPDQFTQIMVDHGVTILEMGELIKQALQIYNQSMGIAPNRAARRAKPKPGTSRS